MSKQVFHMLHDGQQLFWMICMFVVICQRFANLLQLSHIKPYIYQWIIHVASIPT